MSTEYEQIRAMFEAKQARDLEDLTRRNQEIKPLIENSNRILRNTVDVNSLIPPSTKAQ